MKKYRSLEGGTQGRGDCDDTGGADGGDSRVIILVERKDKFLWNMWHLR